MLIHEKSWLWQSEDCEGQIKQESNKQHTQVVLSLFTADT